MKVFLKSWIAGAYLCAAAFSGRLADVKLAPVEELGKKLFFDKNLSTPSGQSCATCHDPVTGWTGSPENVSGIYEGAVKGRFGNRKPPSSAYAGDSPHLFRDKNGDFFGGLFWDGRATGAELNDPLAEQAGGPFLNPLEQNNPDKKAVVLSVRDSGYASLFERVWNIKRDEWERNVDGIYECISRSIASYERSEEVNPFNSKFDVFWRKTTAMDLKVEDINRDNIKKFRDLGLDETELQGLVMFNGKAKCASCHNLKSSPGDKPPVFTDFGYDNIGVPKNSENPFYGMSASWNPAGKDWVDEGLGGALKKIPRFAPFAEEHKGKHKVPTLRNVDLKPSPRFVKTYMHNGVFKSLEDVVHFYNVRDSGKFPQAEVKANMNTENVGKLGLTDDEEKAIVAFLKTLTDGFSSLKK